MSRLLRGWIVGSFATGVAALSHGIVDGGAPSSLSVLLAVLFAGVLGTFAIGRRPSLPRLALVVAGAQLAFHVVFSSLTPGAASGATHHGGATLLGPAVAHHGTDPWMWAAHGLALVATLVFLRHAELALFQLLRDAVLHLVEVVTGRPAIVARPTARRTPSANAPRHPVLLFLRFVRSHRGPPAAAPAH